MTKHTSVTAHGIMQAMLVLVTLILLPAPVQAAAILSGSFSGAAVNSQMFTPPYGNFDGSSITGTFLVDLTGCFVSTGPGPSTGGCYLAKPSFLNPVVPGYSITYGVPDNFVQVTNTATSQRLSIAFGYTNPYVLADFELVGGVNAFLNGSDYSTLHAGVVDLTTSTLLLHGGRSYGTGVALSSVMFDQPVSGVPDAPAWAMLLTGFAMTGLASRRGERLPATVSESAT